MRMNPILAYMYDLRHADDSVVEQSAVALERLAESVRNREVRALTINIDRELVEARNDGRTDWAVFVAGAMDVEVEAE